MPKAAELLVLEARGHFLRAKKTMFFRWDRKLAGGTPATAGRHLGVASRRRQGAATVASRRA